MEWRRCAATGDNGSVRNSIETTGVQRESSDKGEEGESIGAGGKVVEDAKSRGSSVDIPPVRWNFQLSVVLIYHYGGSLWKLEAKIKR